MTDNMQNGSTKTPTIILQSFKQLSVEELESAGATTTLQNGSPKILSENDQVNKGSNGEGRMKWGRNLEFMLSFIGYTVGLGNIWRFPYLCAKNGGAAFLIPYAVFMVLLAFPISYMEVALGQYSGKSAYDVWDMCPALRGVGVSMTSISALFGLYYNIILAWVLYYLYHSFMSPLPWTTCNNWWNTPTCYSFVASNLTNANTTLTGNILSSTQLPVTLSEMVTGNNSVISTQNTTVVYSALEEFWNFKMLGISSGLSEIGSMQWGLVLSLTVSWLMVCLCIIKGVKSVGKVVYVTAVGPYVLIIVILIRAVTLPGADKGILFYVVPDFNRLTDLQVWIQALMQIFYSMGIGWGAIITMSSYNKFKTPILRNTVIFCIMGEGTSFLAGFVVFSVLGFMSYQTGLDVGELIRTGPGLVFITYAEALSQLPLPQLWSVLFFIMLTLVGLDTMFVSVEVCVTTVVDLLPKTISNIRTWVTIGCCVLMFLCTLIYTTNGGIYVFQLVDWYVITFTVYVSVILECFIVAWIYGVDKFFKDVEQMAGSKPSYIFSILWRFITPILLFTVLVSTLVSYKRPSYGTYIFPGYAAYIGWFIAIISSVPIPVWFIREILGRKGPVVQRIKDAFKPSPNWVPAAHE